MKKKRLIRSIASHFGISKRQIRSVDGFPGYFITNCGKVISCLREKPHRLKCHKSNSGYNMVMLRKDGKSHNVYVHHLVLKNFVGDAPVGYHAHFKDRNKENMSLDNLEWRRINTRTGARNYHSNHIHIPDAVIRKAMRLSASNKPKAARRVLTDLSWR